MPPFGGNPSFIKGWRDQLQLSLGTSCHGTEVRDEDHQVPAAGDQPLRHAVGAIHCHAEHSYPLWAPFHPHQRYLPGWQLLQGHPLQSFLLWDLPQHDPDPGSPAELCRHGAGIAVPHRHGIFLFCSGLLWIDPSCLLEIHTQHGGMQGMTEHFPVNFLSGAVEVLLVANQVEDSMMDVYDFVYEEVRRNISSFRRHELTDIHKAFLCCGKHSPFGDTTNVEHKTCPHGQVHDAGQDCLREIQDFLKKHMDFVFSFLGIAIGFAVYGMILTSFLWFSIHFSSNLDRKGKYILRER